jgi:hypothetical protein
MLAELVSGHTILQARSLRAFCDDHLFHSQAEQRDTSILIVDGPDDAHIADDDTVLAEPGSKNFRHHQSQDLINTLFQRHRSRIKGRIVHS